MPITLSSLLLTIQGLPVCLFSYTILTNPVKVNFDDAPLAVQHAMGFGVLSVGVMYLTAAIQPKRTRHHFLLASLPVRLAAAYVFNKDGADARGSAGWDIAMVVLGVLVVAYERLAYLSA